MSPSIYEVFLKQRLIEQGILMKKSHRENLSKKNVLSPDMRDMEKDFIFGNFRSARLLAAAALSAPDTSLEERGHAKKILRMTRPDPMALLVGLVCLTFSLVVASIVSY